MKINVTLSKTELEEIVSKSLFGEQKQICIILEEDPPGLLTPVRDESGLEFEDGWFLVPGDHSEPHCPNEDLIGEIEVQFRNGERTAGDFPEFWGASWVQKYSQYDIVKFRTI